MCIEQEQRSNISFPFSYKLKICKRTHRREYDVKNGRFLVFCCMCAANISDCFLPSPAFQYIEAFSLFFSFEAFFLVSLVRSPKLIADCYFCVCFCSPQSYEKYIFFNRAGANSRDEKNETIFR